MPTTGDQLSPTGQRVTPLPRPVAKHKTSDTATIKLTRGFVSQIDAEDLPRLSGHKWHYGDGYAVRTQYVQGKKVHVRMSRVIMNAPDDLMVDHINGDPLDNRKTNLRLCTHNENMRNQQKQNADNTSKYKGVSFKHNSWRAVIHLSDANGKRQFHLGTFKTEKAAALAYDDAARKYHGDFACLNFPPNSERMAARTEQCAADVAQARAESIQAQSQFQPSLMREARAEQE